MNKTAKEFELNLGDVALSLDESGTVNIYIPETGENEMVPGYVMLVTKIAVLLDNEEFVKFVLDHPWPEGLDLTKGS